MGCWQASMFPCEVSLNPTWSAVERHEEEVHSGMRAMGALLANRGIQLGSAKIPCVCCIAVHQWCSTDWVRRQPWTVAFLEQRLRSRRGPSNWRI